MDWMRKVRLTCYRDVQYLPLDVIGVTLGAMMGNVFTFDNHTREKFGKILIRGEEVTEIMECHFVYSRGMESHE